MGETLKKYIRGNRRSILCVAGGMLTGLIVFFSKETALIYRVEYEFTSDNSKNLPPSLASDTAFSVGDLVFRNFTASRADTSRDENIIRHELKVFASHSESETEIRSRSDKVLDGSDCTIYQIRTETARKPFEYILNFTIAGLLVAGLLNFWSGGKKNG